MSKSYMFSNNEIGYDEYLSILEKTLKEGNTFSEYGSLKEGINAVTMMDDPFKRQKLIEASFLVDRWFHTRSTLVDDTFTKLPIIMTIANMIGNHYDDISKLNTEELATLGHFSFVVIPANMKEHLRLFGNKPLLEAVVEKTSDKMERSQILGVVESKYYEFAIDKTINEEGNDELSRFKLESTMLVKNSSKEELLNMVKPLSELVSDLAGQGYYI